MDSLTNLAQYFRRTPLPPTITHHLIRLKLVLHSLLWWGWSYNWKIKGFTTFQEVLLTSLEQFLNKAYVYQNPVCVKQPQLSVSVYTIVKHLVSNVIQLLMPTRTAAAGGRFELAPSPSRWPFLKTCRCKGRPSLQEGLQHQPRQ